MAWRHDRAHKYFIPTWVKVLSCFTFGIPFIINYFIIRSEIQRLLQAVPDSEKLSIKEKCDRYINTKYDLWSELERNAFQGRAQFVTAQQVLLGDSSIRDLTTSPYRFLGKSVNDTTQATPEDRARNWALIKNIFIDAQALAGDRPEFDEGVILVKSAIQRALNQGLPPAERDEARQFLDAHIANIFANTTMHLEKIKTMINAFDLIRKDIGATREEMLFVRQTLQAHFSQIPEALYSNSVVLIEHLGALSTTATPPQRDQAWAKLTTIFRDHQAVVGANPALDTGVILIRSVVQRAHNPALAPAERAAATTFLNTYVDSILADPAHNEPQIEILLNALVLIKQGAAPGAPELASVRSCYGKITAAQRTFSPTLSGKIATQMAALR